MTHVIMDQKEPTITWSYTHKKILGKAKNILTKIAMLLADI